MSLQTTQRRLTSLQRVRRHTTVTAVSLESTAEFPSTPCQVRCTRVPCRQRYRQQSGTQCRRIQEPCPLMLWEALFHHIQGPCHHTQGPCHHIQGPCHLTQAQCHFILWAPRCLLIQDLCHHIRWVAQCLNIQDPCHPTLWAALCHRTQDLCLQVLWEAQCHQIQWAAQCHPIQDPCPLA
jgi:hypothetical protein